MNVKIIISIVISILCLHLKSQTLLHHIYYKTDSFTLNQEEAIRFDTFIKSLDTVKVNYIKIKGYTDDIGTDEKNYILGLNRAVEIKRLLVQNKVQVFDSIDAISLGRIFIEDMEDKSKLDALRQKHRTAEIILEYSFKAKKLLKKSKTEPNKLTAHQKVGDKIVLDNILFEGGSALFLLKESDSSLLKLVETLNEFKKYHITILGHICCSQDTFDGLDKKTGKHNLSESRAKAVYDYLIEHKIDEKRLQYKGLKNKFPLGKGAKADRRVEIEISKIEDETSPK